MGSSGADTETRLFETTICIVRFADGVEHVHPDRLLHEQQELRHDAQFAPRRRPEIPSVYIMMTARVSPWPPLQERWPKDSMLQRPGTFGAKARRVALPAGVQWRDAWHPDKTYAGGQSMEIRAELHQIPLFIRVGANLPVGDLDREWLESVEIARKKPDLRALESTIKLN